MLDHFDGDAVSSECCAAGRLRAIGNSCMDDWLVWLVTANESNAGVRLRRAELNIDGSATPVTDPLNGSRFTDRILRAVCQVSILSQGRVNGLASQNLMTTWFGCRGQPVPGLLGSPFG